MTVIEKWVWLGLICVTYMFIRSGFRDSASALEVGGVCGCGQCLPNMSIRSGFLPLRGTVQVPPPQVPSNLFPMPTSRECQRRRER